MRKLDTMTSDRMKTVIKNANRVQSMQEREVAMRDEELKRMQIDEILDLKPLKLPLDCWKDHKKLTKYLTDVQNTVNKMIKGIQRQTKLTASELVSRPTYAEEFQNIRASVPQMLVQNETTSIAINASPLRKKSHVSMALDHISRKDTTLSLADRVNQRATQEHLDQNDENSALTGIQLLQKARTKKFTNSNTQAKFTQQSTIQLKPTIQEERRDPLELSLTKSNKSEHTQSRHTSTKEVINPNLKVYSLDAEKQEKDNQKLISQVTLQLQELKYTNKPTYHSIDEQDESLDATPMNNQRFRMSQNLETPQVKNENSKHLQRSPYMHAVSPKNKVNSEMKQLEQLEKEINDHTGILGDQRVKTDSSVSDQDEKPDIIVDLDPIKQDSPLRVGSFNQKSPQNRLSIGLPTRSRMSQETVLHGGKTYFVQNTFVEKIFDCIKDKQDQIADRLESQMNLLTERVNTFHEIRTKSLPALQTSLEYYQKRFNGLVKMQIDVIQDKRVEKLKEKAFRAFKISLQMQKSEKNKFKKMIDNLRKYQQYHAWRKYATISNWERYLQDQNKIEGAYLLLRRFKNRLKAFDQSLLKMNESKADRVDFKNLLKSLEKDRVDTIYNEMKTLFKDTKVDFEVKVDLTEQKLDKVCKNLIKQQTDTLKNFQIKYDSFLTNKVTAIEEIVGKLTLEQNKFHAQVQQKLMLKEQADSFSQNQGENLFPREMITKDSSNDFFSFQKENVFNLKNQIQSIKEMVFELKNGQSYVQIAIQIIQIIQNNQVMVTLILNKAKLRAE